MASVLVSHDVLSTPRVARAVLGVPANSVASLSVFRMLRGAFGELSGSRCVTSDPHGVGAEQRGQKSADSGISVEQAGHAGIVVRPLGARRSMRRMRRN